MSVRINDIVPDFTAETDHGSIQFHDWIGDQWAILFSHPKDFTPVCTTEFGAVAQLADEWAALNTKVIGLSVDGVDEHKGWKADIEQFSGAKAGFPIIADNDLAVSKMFDMLPADAYMPDGRTAADSASVRSVFIISPDKKLQLSMTYPMSVGRNFAEILRALTALQKTFGQPIATPANWAEGQDVIIAMTLNDDAAKAKFGDFDAKLPYLRTTSNAEHGEDAAIALGHELVSGKSKEVRIALWVAATIRDPDSVLYCLRGGLRSQTAQSWLAEAGIEVPIIDGGYKALRRFMIDTFDTQLKNTQALVLGGKTGSAKTSLLVTSDDGSRLPCIDLEGLARHRGSAFGRRIVPQPTQIDFENQISLALLRLHHNEQKTIALEDESRLIGRCALPLNLQAKMRESPLVVVEATLLERVHHSWENYILSNYEDHLVEAGSKELAFIAFSESLRVSLSNIRKRLGNPRFEQLSKVLEQALAAHNSGDPETHKEWIEILLRDYYDPMYDYQLKSKQREIIYRGDFKDVREFLVDRTLRHA